MVRRVFGQRRHMLAVLMVISSCHVIFWGSLQSAWSVTSGVASRRAVLATGCGVLSLAPSQAQAANSQAKDLENVALGYKGLKYLLNNWEKVTRDKLGNPTPRIIMNFVGMNQMNTPLFNSEKLWLRLQDSDLVGAKDADRFQDACEDFEDYKRKSSDQAYQSSWGEANPGGGKDRVEEYLQKSKQEVVKTVDSLGKIVDILQLDLSQYPSRYDA
eukprot:TRINITY_DN76858_c0_g1_i1.p1 TRINITY_DN76858_c0_g1~~TRINITY_DN76858_c0_g1_i1.p1  ORF type:complete len:215 (+),score=39.17 TRINITY_DN76858_c0_g1_i1:34-678(+)